MTSEKILETIMNSSLATELETDEQKVLAGICQFKSLGDGEYLTREGDEEDQLYVVVSGSLAVMKKMSSGDMEILCRLRDHEIAGISGFVHGQKRLAAIMSSGTSEVLSVSRDSFMALCETHPRVVYKVMCTLVRESLEIVRRLDESIVELDEFIHRVHGHY